jgi:hypothetical protein
MTNLPSIDAPRHFPLQPPGRSTAQDVTAAGTPDRPYTRARHIHLVPADPHAQPLPTQQWPNNVVASSYTSPRHASPEISPQQAEPGGVGFPDNQQASSSVMSSPHNSAELALQSTSFEQRPVETHSSKKRHKCDVCGSYWGRPSSLKIHMVSHTRVKGTDPHRLSSWQPN